MNEYYCFDCETQGVKDPYPVQIAIIVESLKYEEVDKIEFNQYIKPITPLSPASTVVHGITNEVAQNYPPGKEILELFKNFMAKEVNPKTEYAVGHNIKFDIDTLDNFVAMHTNEEKGFMPKKPIDTLRLARKLIPEEEIGGYSLDACHYWLFDDLKKIQDLRTLHDAMVDVILTIEIFEKLESLMPEHTGSTLSPLEDVYQFCIAPRLLDKFPFGKHKGLEFDKVPTGYISWVMKNIPQDEQPDVFYTIQQRLGIDPI